MKIQGRARLIVLVVVAVAALGFYLYSERVGPPPEVPVAEPLAPSPPTVRHPVPEPETPPEPAQPDDPSDVPRIPEPEPPGLEQSDEIIRQTLTDLLGEEPVATLLAPDEIVPRLVLAIDSLDRSAIPVRMRPVIHVPGLPAVEEDNERKLLAEANAERYRAHLDALAAVDLDQLAAFYFDHYHWFQQAYEELGYPDGYFNDRLVDIIDHLVAAPEPARPLELTRPEVLYEFADPGLEAASWGRKALYRLSPEQAEEIKDWLRELRSRIAPE